MTKCELSVSDVQIRCLATVARYKLGVEFARASTNLRVVVGHATLLDSLEAKLGESQLERERFTEVYEAESEDRVIEQFRWSEAELEGIEEGDEDFDDAETVRDETVEEAVYFEEDESDNDSGNDSDSDCMEDYSVDNPQFRDLYGEWNTVLIEPW
jgi:hypothetical protein